MYEHQTQCSSPFILHYTSQLNCYTKKTVMSIYVYHTTMVDTAQSSAYTCLRPVPQAILNNRMRHHHSPMSKGERVQEFHSYAYLTTKEVSC